MSNHETIIRFVNVNKTYEGKVKAVDDMSFEVRSGTLLALLGSSGCGKTTTLRLIAGLERPDSGEIWLNEQLVAGSNAWVEPEKRKVGMVFQDYALFPHMSVESNVAFAIPELSRREKKQRISDMLHLVGLGEHGKRFPHQLSGGQQQRVALARAMAANPAVVLLDEPFSNLDAALRQSTRTEVRAILKKAAATTVFVTHDQEEALSIADEIAVIKSGELLQLGSPRRVYMRPAVRAVADFIGGANFVPGTAHGDRVRTIFGDLPLLTPAHGDVDVMLRPEQIQLEPQPQAPYTIDMLQFLGHGQLVDIHIKNGQKIQARIPVHSPLEVGMRVNIQVEGSVMAYSIKGNGTR
jgi:iron(III) transport system ATP-binding protein